LKPVLDLAGPTQVLFGSDFPYASPQVVAAEIEALERFDAVTRPAMEETNALALFPRLASASRGVAKNAVPA
jgi:predicted TIM-barrel fold metal-dependent hydrolase